jgi:Uma2 family endonuclease
LTDPTPGDDRRLTAEEWSSLDEDEEGELVAGVLEPEEMPDAVHELTVSFLIRTLGTWLAGAGFVLGSEVKLLVAPRTGRKPDMSVFLPGTTPPPRRGLIRKPPYLVVEVISPSPRDERRDRVVKTAEYAAFGVTYYWLVDPALGTFEIFERNARDHRRRLLSWSVREGGGRDLRAHRPRTRVSRLAPRRGRSVGRALSFEPGRLARRQTRPAHALSPKRLR